MEHKTEILAAAVEELLESRMVAAQELHKMNATSNDNILDVTVTCDGTWTKQEFTCQFGIIMVLSWESSQVSNYEVWSKYNHKCKLREGVECSSAAYQRWWQGHEDKWSMIFCSHGL